MASAVIAAFPETAGRPARQLHVATGVAADWQAVGAEDAVIVCPWLAGLDPVAGLWLAVLPIHDCNAFVDDDWRLEAPDALRPNCWVGIFAIDRLRSSRQLLAPLRERGVERLINLPSVSFFDGAASRTFGRLDFSLAAERSFLTEAMAAGFTAALCARRDEPIAPDDQARYDFLLRHGGPGEAMTVEPRTSPAAWAGGEAARFGPFTP